MFLRVLTLASRKGKKDKVKGSIKVKFAFEFETIMVMSFTTTDGDYGSDDLDFDSTFLLGLN